MTIEEFLAKWTTAERDGDTTAIEPWLTDDFTGVGPLGFTLTREAWLARHASGGMVYESFDLEDQSLRTYGDTVVVTARQHAVGTYNGNPTPTDVRVTVILIRNADSWLISTVHMSFMAGTPGAPTLPGRP
jgi:ketosteroid isomerase-like protein